MEEQRKRKRKFHIKKLLAGIAVIAAVYFIFSGGDEKQENIQIVKPEIGTIEETVTAQGKLEPKEYVDVGAQVSGRVEKLHVEIGDVVKKGDLIAEIDPQVYESRVAATVAQLKRLRAQLTEQQTQVQLTKQQNDRNERLMKSDAVSREELETTQAQYKAALANAGSIRAQIEETESTLEGDKANLSYTKIYAPMDGTVSAQTTREGQTVNANQTAPVIVQLANLDIMTIRAQVAEADVMRLSEDMPVYFTTLGSLEKKWQAKVRQILPTPEVINEVVLYNALIDVDNKERKLMNGMSVQVFFELGKAENVLTIPSSALGKRLRKEDTKDGEAYSVNVKNGSKTEARTVWIGMMNRSIAEVKKGLSENDQVVIVTAPADAEKKPASGGGGRGMRGAARL